MFSEGDLFRKLSIEVVVVSFGNGALQLANSCMKTQYVTQRPLYLRASASIPPYIGSTSTLTVMPLYWGWPCTS